MTTCLVSMVPGQSVVDLLSWIWIADSFKRKREKTQKERERENVGYILT